jgi:hypothetical protein
LTPASRVFSYTFFLLSCSRCLLRAPDWMCLCDPSAGCVCVTPANRVFPCVLAVFCYYESNSVPQCPLCLCGLGKQERVNSFCPS